MNPIAIFYHGLFFLGDDPPVLLHSACRIVTEQMNALRESGLAAQSSLLLVGLNGGEESAPLAAQCVPERATIVYHGLKSRAENLTLVELEKWLPGHEDWYVLYFHAKGCTHKDGEYAEFCARWRRFRARTPSV